MTVTFTFDKETSGGKFRYNIPKNDPSGLSGTVYATADSDFAQLNEITVEVVEAAEPAEATA